MFVYSWFKFHDFGEISKGMFEIHQEEADSKMAFAAWFIRLLYFLTTIIIKATYLT
jgi:hypothetical protein